MAKVPKTQLTAPFTWFGGKSRVAADVWARFGTVDNYVEPFAGSLAVLLGRPSVTGREYVNDKDAFIANFWRASIQRPDDVVKYATWPMNEADLVARSAYLRQRRDEFTNRVLGDPMFCDPVIAGWWVWGQCTAVDGNWLAPGPWRSVDGVLTRVDDSSGVIKGRPKSARTGMHGAEDFMDRMHRIRDRMRHVTVLCGDWERSLRGVHGVTAVFLDPPYAGTADRAAGCYAVDSFMVAHDVRSWAIGAGADPQMRIAVCGYEGEHLTFPPNWECMEWAASGGWARRTSRGKVNATRERIWFSPHCIRPGKDSP